MKRGVASRPSASPRCLAIGQRGDRGQLAKDRPARSVAEAMALIAQRDYLAIGISAEFYGVGLPGLQTERSTIMD